MTGEELIREVWRRWNAGERGLPEDLVDPEFEVRSALTGDAYRGEAEVRRWQEEIDQQFDGWELTIERVRMLDGSRALASGSIRGHGRASGIELDQPAAWIVEIAGGRLISVHNFIGADAADEAEREAGGGS